MSTITYWHILLGSLIGVLLPLYLQVIAGVCSQAYFKEKLKYQTNFFREFDGARRSNLGG